MNPSLEDWVVEQTGARQVVDSSLVQSLWSGYGRILRLTLGGSDRLSSVIVKQVSPPDRGQANPRGWSGETAHQRKLRSYHVESEWYQSWSSACDDSCRVPRCIAIARLNGERRIILEDLSAGGFDRRHHHLSDRQIRSCLQWLASFHARFFQRQPGSLWKVGTYWHLETRPDEWEQMPNGPLKEAAGRIDDRLNRCRYSTLVHGDAKVANFCFDDRAGRVAAVDFQYVGGGCGIKDVAYFLGSCLTDEQLESQESEWLEEYFRALSEQLSPTVADDVVNEWTELFPWAWADFHRFLAGWCPTHPKLTTYSQRMVDRVLSDA